MQRARAEWATARSQLCLAHAECAAVALNEDLSYATLKASLYPSVAAVAVTVQTKDEWRSYLRNSSAHLTGEARDVWVASAHLGADFGCVDSEVAGKCEFACAQPRERRLFERSRRGGDIGALAATFRPSSTPLSPPPRPATPFPI